VTDSYLVAAAVDSFCNPADVKGMDEASARKVDFYTPPVR